MITFEDDGTATLYLPPDHISEPDEDGMITITLTRYRTVQLLDETLNHARNVVLDRQIDREIEGLKAEGR